MLDGFKTGCNLIVIYFIKIRDLQSGKHFVKYIFIYLKKDLDCINNSNIFVINKQGVIKVITFTYLDYIQHIRTKNHHEIITNY